MFAYWLATYNKFSFFYIEFSICGFYNNPKIRSMLLLHKQAVRANILQTSCSKEKNTPISPKKAWPDHTPIQIISSFRIVFRIISSVSSVSSVSSAKPSLVNTE